MASVNSLAITAAMVYPGANNEAWMLGSFPITMVTAMVSPKARAKPRKIEPKDSQPRVGHHHLPGGLPARGAQRQRGFPLFGRHFQQRFAGDGNNEGQRHDGQDHAGREIAEAENRAREDRQEPQRFFRNGST